MKSFKILAFSISLILSIVFFSDNFLSVGNIFFKKEKSKTEKKLYPYEWAYLKKTWPYLNADPRATLDALEQAHRLDKETAEQRLNKSLNSVAWEFIGPLNVGGRVVDIEFNPSDPNIVYAGFATGGVFKSTDMGSSWFPVFDSLAVLTVGDIGIDPQNSDVIYVGTGEPNGGHNNFPGGGVFKSTNAGSTWQFLGLEETTSIGRVLVHPVNSNIVYLAAVGSYFAPNEERGVYKSTDAGLTWNKSLFISDSTGAIDIIMDPTNPDRMMAAMWERVRRPNSSHLFGPSSGIYKTSDGGNNWQLIPPSAGLPNPNTQNVGRIGLALSQNNPDIVYTLFNNGVSIISLFKSTDFGNNWIDVDPDNELQDGASTFSWYFGQIRVHPSNPDIVYVMDVAFMRSSNGGNTWPIIYGYGGPDQLHVDHHALAFNPTNPSFIINGNDGGMNISTDGGASWSNPVHIPATQFYEIGLDASNPLAYYGGTQDNGTNRTLDGGIDNWQHIYGGDGFYVIVDFNNSNIIYAESQNGGLGKSTDGGNNFFSATNGINSNEPTNWSTPVVMDPNNNNILYYGTNYLYRTTNGASNWVKISPQLTDWVQGRRLGTLTTMAIAPTNSNVIYVGTDDSHVWVSTDNGTNWTEISDGLPERWVTRVAVDPTDENIVYATFNGLKWRDPQPHVFRSTDKGTTWSDISSNLPDAPVNAFAVDPVEPSRLYLGNDVGMYVSFNSGLNWWVLGEGLPILPIGDIKIHSTTRELVAGTYGRSMYKIDLNQIPTIVESSEPVVAGFILEQNYPNPFNPSTKIKYTIPSVTLSEVEGSLVSLKIYDLLGNEVSTLVNEEKPAGSYEVEFNAEGLSSGVYFYKLQLNNFTDTKKMILIR
ncbi:MAG: T9SS type A sorting domain-containing protein [Ignavibacteriaceae bacterium]|nr:T9SS type A sorting domain-containing protein [Ignavibacteriaceae bacterium]